MVIKSKRGRRRYIALCYLEDSKVTEEALYAFLTHSLGRPGIRYKVIQFDGRRGIVRVGGVDQLRAIEAINGYGNGPWKTLRTSGTLRTLREDYLKEGSG